MKKRKNSRGELNFWQPSSDLMTGLVLILILIIILLLLYLLYTPESIEGDLTNGTTADTDDYDGYGSTDLSTEGNTWDQRGDSYDDGSGNGSNEPTYYGGGSGDGRGDDVGILPGFDEGVKSAVYVEVVDAETLKTIKKAGVSFELYGKNGELEILNTYYPVKTSYKKYETTREGVFYLPEKIFEGKYSLKELTAPEGYDSAGSVDFTVDKLYDWPEPLVVQVPLSPSRNIIRVRMTDADQGTAVGGAAFDVIAAEDITTKDGTVRYTKGQKVDTITLDEEGYGESKELYLGSYTLKQSTVPEYYASVSKNLSAIVSKKTETESEAVEARANKTRIELALTDELTGQAIAGAEFEVTEKESGAVQQAETDGSGRIVLTDLDKGTSYQIRQISAPENYRTDTSEHSLTVSENGRIKGKAAASLKLTNRMLRVQIGVEDSILHRQVAGKELVLKKSDGTEVASWTTADSARVFTDLEEGTYSVCEAGQEEAEDTFTVSDTAELQIFNRKTLTRMGILTLAGGVAAAAGFIALLTALIRKLGRRRSSKKTAENNRTESETDGHKE